mmetsp:Transcript_3305/g.8212  ORF Transcript_3305/g.8212 Transcript_3305/m.8212 type:complete len:243 (+) Transcript_3305:589-1317(+)
MAHPVLDVRGHDPQQRAEPLAPRHRILVPPLVDLPVRARVGGDGIQAVGELAGGFELLQVDDGVGRRKLVVDVVCAEVDGHAAARERQPHLLGGVPRARAAVLQRKVKHIVGHEVLELRVAGPAPREPQGRLSVVHARPKRKDGKVCGDLCEDVRTHGQTVHGEPRHAGDPVLAGVREELVVLEHGPQGGTEGPPQRAGASVKVGEVVELAHNIRGPEVPAERAGGLVRKVDVHLVGVRLGR